MIKAENAVLGALLSDERAVPLVTEKLNPGDFTGNNGIIYQAICDLYNDNKPIDIISVSSSLDGKISDAAILLCSLVESATGYWKNVSYHADIVKSSSHCRKIELASKIAINACKENALDVALDTLTRALEDTSQTHADSVYDHEKSSSDFVNRLLESRENIGIKGFSTGMVPLDTVISGIERGKMYVIGALKKTGKSRLAHAMSSHFLNQELGGITFSMEMLAPAIHTCILANRLKINTAHFGTSRLSEEDYFRITSEMNRYAYQNLHINTKSKISPQYVRSCIRGLKKKQPVDFVIIDYIQRMSAGKDKRTQDMEACATGIADIARDENVAAIVLTQFSGEAERDIKRNVPLYAYVKESQAIVEAADCGLFVDDPNRGREFEFDREYKDLKILVLQREGASDVWVPLKAYLKYCQFECSDTI